MPLNETVILSKNPYYEKMKEEWEFFELSYNGGRPYILDNCTLIQYTRESKADYDKRRQRAWFKNCCESVVNIWASYIFREKTIRNYGGIEAFHADADENIDLSGTDVFKFWANAARMAATFGHAFILVDMPIKDESIITRADEIALGIRPYLRLISPLNVPDWEVDTNGDLTYIRIEYDYTEPRDWNKPRVYGKPKRRSLIYTREEWFVVNEQNRVVFEGAHGLGIVPVSILYFDKLAPLVSKGMLNTIAYINNSLYNKDSQLDQILCDITFPMMTIQADEGELKDLNVGATTVLRYPREASAPGFISPSDSPARLLMENHQALVNEIYQTAMLTNRSADMSAVTQSGTSKAWDFNDTNSGLAAYADNIQNAEINANKIIAKWLGTEFDGSIIYPDTFDIQGLSDMIAQALDLTSMSISPTFDIETKKRIASKSLVGIEPEIMDKIINEIETQASTPLIADMPEQMPDMNNVDEEAEGLNDRNQEKD